MVQIDGLLDKDILNAIEQVHDAIASSLRLPKSILINLTIVDEATIRNLNRTTRNINKVTDVLTYPYIDLKVGEHLRLKDYQENIDPCDKMLTIGDIYICMERARSQAAEYGHTLKREVSFLFCHGMLHICGYDHIDPNDAKVMEQKQDAIMNKCGISRINFKSGFVTIVGETNVGKSTLINTLVGEHVAIVSPKTQTTRENILGIYNDADSQIVFVDTPGYHKRANKIDDIMDNQISEAMEDTEIVLLMISAKKSLSDQFDQLYKKISKQAKKILLINKIDEVTFERLYPQLAKLDATKVDEILPISALKGKNREVLINMVKKYLPSFDYEMRYFPIDEYTDKNLRHITAEIVREKALLLLDDEVPHGVAVVVEGYNESTKPIEIYADIYCEKESHKPIILGKNGAMIKEISTKSRQAIERIIGEKVNLQLFVKVKPNWRNDNKALESFGYISE